MGKFEKSLEQKNNMAESSVSNLTDHIPSVSSWNSTMKDYESMYHPLDAGRKKRNIIIGVVIGVVVIVALIITLVLVFTGSSSSTPAESEHVRIPSNAPLRVNGDNPFIQSTTFTSPQLIENPNPTQDMLFAAHMFVHNAGYVAASATDIQLQIPVLYFFFTSREGSIQGSQRVPLNFLPAGMVICNGAFAPIFNRINEVYYLFISVGYLGIDDDSNNSYATHIILFCLDSSLEVTEWKQSNLNSNFSTVLASSVDSSKNIKALKIPVHNFVWNRQKPYIGTFGDKLQAVQSAALGSSFQSLYANGSQYSTSSPGGTIYWMILNDNLVSPSITARVVQIQDAKLYRLRDQWINTEERVKAANDFPSCKDMAGNLKPPPTEDQDNKANYIHGFGASFFVTSGQGTPILVVGNQTNQDYCQLLTAPNQPAAPNGYVQGFTYNASTNLSWQQTTNDYGYDYRYMPVGDAEAASHFGYSVSWAQGSLMVGTSGSKDGLAQYPVYKWSPGTIFKGTLVRQATIRTGLPSPEVNLTLPRFNLGATVSADARSVVVNSRKAATNNATDLLSVQNPNAGTSAPFADFETIQELGETFNSDSASDVPKTRLGFAQYMDTWLSRTGQTLRLAVNDPRYNSNVGRLLVLTKTRTA